MSRPLITYWILTVYLTRVKSLKIILDDVEIVLPQRDLTDDQDKMLRDVAEGCHNVLSALKQQLEKYQELGPDPKSWDSKNLRFKVQRGWKRLKWDAKDVEEFRSRIVSNISLLNAFYGRLTRYLSTLFPNVNACAAKLSSDKILRRQKKSWIDWTSTKMTKSVEPS